MGPVYKFSSHTHIVENQRRDAVYENITGCERYLLSREPRALGSGEEDVKRYSPSDGKTSLLKCKLKTHKTWTRNDTTKRSNTLRKVQPGLLDITLERTSGVWRLRSHHLYTCTSKEYIMREKSPTDKCDSLHVRKERDMTPSSCVFENANNHDHWIDTDTRTHLHLTKRCWIRMQQFLH